LEAGIVIIRDTLDGPVVVDPADLSNAELVAFIRDPACQAELRRRADAVRGSVHPFHLPGEHSQPE
jgi:hypothetical protein